MSRLHDLAAVGRRVLARPDSKPPTKRLKRPVALRLYYRSEADELLYVVVEHLTAHEADELRERAGRSEYDIVAVTPHEEDYPALDRSRRVVLPSQRPDDSDLP